MAATTNGTKASNKVVSPTKLAHVVLRTNNLEKMLDFYCIFLGGHVVHHTDSLSFMTYDDEHHRIAFIQTPHCQEKIKNSNGLEHIAFTFPTLTDLFTAWKQRLDQHGIKPVWCTNHGPNFSIYYKDPDNNMIETQYDVFGDDAEGVKKATEYFHTEEYAENPIGIDFDPEVMWERLQKEGEEAMAKEVQVRGPRGNRGIEGIPKEYME